MRGLVCNVGIRWPPKSQPHSQLFGIPEASGNQLPEASGIPNSCSTDVALRLQKMVKVSKRLKAYDIERDYDGGDGQCV